MTDDDRTLMAQLIEKTVQTTVTVVVNGKIDKLSKKIDDHNCKHEADMERVLPVIEAYEEAQQTISTGKKSGKFLIFIATIITAVGGAYLILKQIFA